MSSCKRCGRCCQAEVCPMGLEVYKTSFTPCPGLKLRGNKHSCELFEIVSDEHRAFLRFRMGIGFGCDSVFDEKENPYLLSDEELNRTEDAAKRGDRF